MGSSLKNKESKAFPIVALGASAGGVQALMQFFSHVPADSGMAYVVILHLSPDHDSKLAELLSQVTSLPVIQLTKKEEILANRVYIIPPNKHLRMEGECITVSPNLREEDRRAPIDIFFRTLAEAQGPRALCVILSGTGANGSMGLKRIKEWGGAAFVQNPREAEYNEMPRNAIATDLIDEVLPVTEIPKRLVSYRKNLGEIQIHVEKETKPESQQKALREKGSLFCIRIHSN